jgi:phosphopantothenoylcysteine decarboxylase/phosphopantothenate--cysteine ligase
MSGLHNKRIIVGVTGSIAAYKVADLVSKLTQSGTIVDVVFSQNAARFVTPLTFSALSQRPVWHDPWEATGEAAARHIEVAQGADIFIVAPASANSIARLAHGMADDLLSTIALATTAPLIIAPAMEHHMWTHPATQANIQMLVDRGAHLVSPDAGRLASGEIGTGRLPDTATLIGAIRVVLGRTGDLAGRNVVVTAGGTQEPIDPVRVISNRSSGLQGFAIATIARDRGAKVTLIAGSTSLSTPYGITRIDALTAAKMHEAVLESCKKADVLVMAAAVADFTPVEVADHKIKKESVTADGMTIALNHTVDILSDLNSQRDHYPRLIRVGFAAETRDVLSAGRDKLVRKGLDLIVINNVSDSDSGFGTPTNRVWIIGRKGFNMEFPLLKKEVVAEHLWDQIVPLLAALESD